MRHQVLLDMALMGTLTMLVSCANDPLPNPVQTVRAGLVERVQPDVPERYSVSIVPVAQVDLAFKSAGLIERIAQVRGVDGRLRNVQAGDYVARDTELARVRAIDYQQRVDQAEAQLAGAQAQLAQAQANYSAADLDYSRAKSLFESASLVKPQFDQAKARYESGAASVKAAQAAVSNAQTVLGEAKLSLNDASIRAPFDGWVTARNVERGALVGNATLGFSLIDIHLVKAVFAVSDTSLAKVRLGQPQSVMLDTLPHPLRGVVTAISPQADSRTRVFSVEVTLENPRGEIKPGMIGSLSLAPVGETAPRLVIPLSAVVRAPSDPTRFAVFQVVERGGKAYAESQVIQIGQTLGNSIEVISGLSAGQRVVALGGSLVRDGQEVRLLP